MKGSKKEDKAGLGTLTLALMGKKEKASRQSKIVNGKHG